ncbi:MAG: hypothetical protein DMF49_00295 [Acidobacteria bacterium]|nr:MAG: hypothetical protein DMF49_00295 [Acidobacteriota bacterium]
MPARPLSSSARLARPPSRCLVLRAPLASPDQVASWEWGRYYNVHPWGVNEGWKVKQETLLGQPALDRQSIETLWLNLDPQTADPEPRIDSTGPPAAPEELWLALKELQQQNRELTEKYRKADGAHGHYRRLFEHAPDGFLATDLAGTIQQANHAAASLLRLPERELTGKSLILFVSGRDRKRLESPLPGTLEDPPALDAARHHEAQAGGGEAEGPQEPVAHSLRKVSSCQGGRGEAHCPPAAR